MSRKESLEENYEQEGMKRGKDKMEGKTKVRKLFIDRISLRKCTGGLTVQTFPTPFMVISYINYLSGKYGGLNVPYSRRNWGLRCIIRLTRRRQRFFPEEAETTQDKRKQRLLNHLLL